MVLASRNQLYAICDVPTMNSERGSKSDCCHDLHLLTNHPTVASFLVWCVSQLVPWLQQGGRWMERNSGPQLHTAAHDSVGIIIRTVYIWLDVLPRFIRSTVWISIKIYKIAEILQCVGAVKPDGTRFIHLCVSTPKEIIFPSSAARSIFNR